MNSKIMLGVILAAAATAAYADSAKFKSANAGATADAAADYLAPANWYDNKVGNASGRDVTFDARTDYGFIKLTDDITVGAFSAYGSKLALVGDQLITVTKNADSYTRIQTASIYADLKVATGTNAEGYYDLSVCGDIVSGGY